MTTQPGVKPWTKIPDYFDAAEMTTGILAFNEETCRRCGICSFICPARSIKSDRGPMKWKEGMPWLATVAPDVTNCIACGCCLAACPEGAITIERWFNPGYFYQRLSQTSDLVYPKCYLSTDPAPADTWPAPDPDMLSPRYGSREKWGMRANRLRMTGNVILGGSRFFLNEALRGRLFSTVNGFLSKTPSDISWTDLLEENARRVPDKPFLVYQNESYTYRQVDEQANRMARFLLALGGGQGSGVGILMRNSPRFLDIFFGAQKIGMYVVPINPELKGDGLAYIINHSDIDLLVADAELADAVRSVADRFEQRKKIIVNDIEAEARGMAVPETMDRLSRAYADFSPQHPGTGYRPEDICMIMYTSGTTGPPKGVVYRYNKTSVRLMCLAAHLMLRPSDTYYTPYALCHGNALLATTTMTMGVRATMALARKFSASRFWEDVRRHRATVFNTIGSIIPILMKQPEKPDDADNHVRFVTSSGCPPEMWGPFEKRFGVKLYEAYGAIDGGGKGIFNFGTAPAGSLGRIPRVVNYRLVDDRGRDVPVGVPGELLFEAKKTSGRVEYYKNPAASRKKSGDGWLHTGDLVKQDINGFLYFVGRNTESMRKGGENVSAYEVEQVIMDHPAVEEAAVYAVPSDLAEDDILAAVRLVATKTLTPEDLIAFLSDRLARFAVPRYIRFMDEFPKTSSHRIIKGVLEKEGITDDTFDAQQA
ncbi:AMP-binding protein [Desulfosudis oleivorans]|uniref:AMP-dependent synthetase and ligase n=1 Tax=Desulfosudis oleivorans (strain DSM 6200 / JCM 39069 / Hxd3) TaxID=96561 RepID=A8ZRT3_DESOH|nr:AMP-binding protein [Desulfosudis oleivorans]ABW65850.1 AMP-dependent synthetase and ligase [Desulfosudis oleivorans Hxd3]